MKKAPRPRKEAGMSKTMRAVLLVVGMVGGPLLVTTIVLLPWIVPALRHQALKSAVKPFAALAPDRDTSQGPYVTGKVILIDRKEGVLDPVQNRLPDDIRAYGEDEVGTVIWLEWDFKENTGDWGKVTSHYSTCKLTVIDRSRNLIVGEVEVMGASSPVATGAGRGHFRAPPGTMTARRANREVAQAVTNLPRR